MNYKYLLIYVIYSIVIISLLAYLIRPTIVIAEPIPEEIAEVRFNYAEGSFVPEFVIQNIIARHATGTKAYQMLRTIYCECHYRNVQSNIIDRRGHREESFGLSQIHLPSHPNVTKAQALDIEFAIRFMSDHWENTKWYGYSRLHDKCN
jgi:hypothetical protein